MAAPNSPFQRRYPPEMRERAVRMVRAAGEALGTHRFEAWQDDVGDDGAHGHGPPGCQTGAVGPSPATPVAETAGWVFGIDEAFAALDAALRRLRRGPEVAS